MYRARQTLLITTVALLLVFGLTMLYSTTYDIFGEALLQRQLVWIVLGAGGALLLSALDYRWLSRYAGWMLLALGICLAYLAIANVMNHRVMPEGIRSVARALPLVSGLHVGSARWLGLKSVRVQPSEFASLAIILFLSRYFSFHGRHLHTFYRGFFKPMMVVGVLVGLILLGGDLSTTVITGGMIFWLCFFAGVRLRFLVLTVLVGAVVGLTALHIDETRMSRTLYYRSPEQYQQRETYQLWMSQLAMGSGGWSGVGFTEGRIKRRYLPESHTDFIIAIIGEELGFLGVAAAMVFYATMVFSILWIGAAAPDREGMMVCSGVALALGLRAFVNIGVVSGFLPTTGVTAPLISYGGSSAVASLLGAGLVLNVGRIASRAALQRAASANSEVAEPPRYDLSHRQLPTS